MTEVDALKPTLETATPSAEITFERDVPKDLDKFIENPGLPRALVAPSKEKPEGTPGTEQDKRTVMQKHVTFFDRNGDGVIYPWETYTGFRAVGFNPIFSILAAIIINTSFSFVTMDGWIPHPLFPVYIKNIHKGKHGSDSGTYDTEGRFIPQKFEEIFFKYDRKKRGALDIWELQRMIASQRVVADFFGWFAAMFEWLSTWLLAADKNGLVSKEDIRAIYDGSYFYDKERSLKSRYQKMTKTS